MQRSEADMITKAPVAVMLGDNEVQLKPLPILKAREWRCKLVAVMGEVLPTLQTNDNEQIGPAMTAAMLKFPERIADLVFDYEPLLDREKVLAEATEEQMTVVFGVIMSLMFPFLAHLATSMKVSLSQ